MVLALFQSTSIIDCTHFGRRENSEISQDIHMLYMSGCHVEILLVLVTEACFQLLFVTIAIWQNHQGEGETSPAVSPWERDNVDGQGSTKAMELSGVIAGMMITTNMWCCLRQLQESRQLQQSRHGGMLLCNVFCAVLGHCWQLRCLASPPDFHLQQRKRKIANYRWNISVANIHPIN